MSAIEGEYEDAIFHMKTALQNDPTDYTLWNKLGVVEAHSTIKQVCVPVSVALLSCPPEALNSTMFDVELPVMLWWLQCKQAAAASYKRALEIRPTYNRAVENLRYLEWRLQKDDSDEMPPEPEPEPEPQPEPEPV